MKNENERPVNEELGHLDACNTGGMRTIPSSIDYVGFTVRHDQITRERLERLIGKQRGWQPSNPAFNYMFGKKLGNIGMYWGGQANTLHIEITGQGCRWLEETHNLKTWTDWATFLEEILVTGATFTRIDFAFDDYQHLVNYQSCLEAAVSGSVVGLQTYHVNIRGRTRNGYATGLGVTFGGILSNYRVRIYDKALQLKREGHWTRVEVQLRDEYASTLLKAFIKGGYEPIVCDLAARLSFRDKNPCDQKRSRWQVCSWWGEFLGGAIKHKIPIESSEKSEDQRQQALVKQWGKVIGELQATPEGKKDLVRILKESEAKFHHHICSLEVPPPPRFGGLQGYLELQASVRQNMHPITIRARHLMRR